MPKRLHHMRALKAKMVYEGWNQKDLAKKLNRSATYISRRMNGTEAWSTNDIEEIVTVLKIYNIGEFFAIFFPNIKTICKE